MTWWKRFDRAVLRVSHPDPDEARRAWLLNVLMLLIGTLCGLTLVTVAAFQAAGHYHPEVTPLTYRAAGGLLGGIAVLYPLNRRGLCRAAAVLFVAGLIAALAVSDTPREIAAGRGLLHMALPIVVAGIVLPPAYTFAAAGAASAVVLYLSWSVGELITPFSSFAFLVVAFVSWLSGRTIDRALSDLRALNRDLDRRVEARTRELSEANERLEQLDRLKDQFLSMVSHELRTPLGAIIGYSDMLEAGLGGPLNADQAGFVRSIVAAGKRLLSLVNDLLDRAQIEAGNLALRCGQTRLDALVEEVRVTMAVLAEAKGLELVCRMADDAPLVVWGDMQRLQQIAVNLLNNAIKFTAQGCVEMMVGRADEARWHLSISDTGPGIPPQARAYIFEPFRRVDDSATRREGGAGLGLSIVKKLVDLMNGEIALESEIGRGSTFTVMLPIGLEEQG